MNPKLLADIIDQYIEDHENDGGSHERMNNNFQTVHTLSAIANILRLYAEAAENPA